MCALFHFQASFVADGSSDISVDDPEFWQKWAEKAKLDLDELANKVQCDKQKFNYRTLWLCYVAFLWYRIVLFLIHLAYGVKFVVMAMTTWKRLLI